MKINPFIKNKFKLILTYYTLISLVGCSTNIEQKKPNLITEINVLNVNLSWSLNIGKINFPLVINPNGSKITTINSEGVFSSFDSKTGVELSHENLNSQITAGVGSDNNFSSAINNYNELITTDNAKKIWRQQLPAQSFTAPLIAGSRVFTLTADNSVTAFDAKTGQKIWGYQRPAEPLVLRQSGVLTAVDNTLVVNFSGRLVGFNPENGTIRWESTIATSRGANDIERLIDIVGKVGRDGDIVCVRAFQTAVGCINTARGSILWKKSAVGSVGLDMDDKYVFGAESDGKIIAWHRADGERAWVSDQLRYRNLSAPLVVGRSVVVGDENGEVHFLSRENGTHLARLTTDGSAVVGTPILAAGTLIVATKNGGIFGFRPE